MIIIIPETYFRNYLLFFPHITFVKWLICNLKLKDKQLKDIYYRLNGTHFSDGNTSKTSIPIRIIKESQKAWET